MRQFTIEKDRDNALRLTGKFLVKVREFHGFCGCRSEYVLYRAIDDNFVCHRIDARNSYKSSVIIAHDFKGIERFFGKEITVRLFDSRMKNDYEYRRESSLAMDGFTKILHDNFTKDFQISADMDIK